MNKAAFLSFVAGMTAVSLALPCVSLPARAQEKPAPAKETAKEKDARMAWWRDARFGMFIHWGLYAVPAGVWDGKNVNGLGEWLMHDAKIPVADYAPLASKFNPQQFDAEAWAKLAKSAGMRYVVITAKHHDGFALFHSTTDPFNIYDATAFKRDPVQELADACRKNGLKFGVYYSQAQDWHQPGGAAYGGHWDTAQNGSYDEYLKKVSVPQVRELITRYKPDVLWWDTPADMTPERAALFTPVLALAPKLITNNRLGGGMNGDTETPEQHIPSTGYPNRDWETCMTLNDTWGYKSTDTNFKPTENLIHNLVDIASKGGNYLLNVGPDATGIIPAPEVARLKNVGDWMAKNGGSIYGTSASPYRRLPFDGRATRKGDHLYLHVFNWPDDGLTLSGLQTPVKSARVLSTGETLGVTLASDGTLSISRPKTLDAYATVVDLQLTGQAVVVEGPLALAPQANGGYKLTATDATLKGDTVQIEQRGGADNIGFWTNASDRVQWTVNVPATVEGEYRVEIEYACDAGSDGSAIVVQAGSDNGAGATGTVAATGDWSTYKTMPLTGTIPLGVGTQTVTITPRSKPGFAVMNLRAVRLTRVRFWLPMEK